MTRSPVRAAAALALTAIAAPASVALAAGDGELQYIRFGIPAGRIVEDGLADHARAMLTNRGIRIERKLAGLRGEKFSASRARNRFEAIPIDQLQARIKRLGHSVTVLRRTGGAPAVAIPAALSRIAACESGGNPRAIGGGGAYRGKYQFDYGTWARVGGTGDPAAASELEQDRRAAMLYARAGSSPWPVCG